MLSNNGNKNIMLPNCKLTQGEWEACWGILSQKKKTGWADARAIIRTAHEKRFANEPICMVCGNESKKATGICSACMKRLYYNGELRSYGHVRGFGYGRDNKPCAACGNPKVFSSHLCRNCYGIKQKFDFKTNEEVRAYKLRQKSKTTPVRDITPDEAKEYGYAEGSGSSKA